MIRNYREIAKTGSNLSLLAAGKSQGTIIGSLFDRMKITKAPLLSFTDTLPGISDSINTAEQAGNIQLMENINIMTDSMYMEEII